MKYVIKKTGTLIITLIVSFLSFFAFSVIPRRGKVKAGDRSHRGTGRGPAKGNGAG
ncbi:MAG: hypothetical protein ACLT5C_09170 [Blautia hansenii]